MAHRLVPQSYGLAMAQRTFGGPTGVWLECCACPVSERIIGTPDPMDMTDAEVAAVYLAKGWTGEGPSLKKARCPKCSFALVTT